jgi:tetratricopeptide (TPR) repeat protein
MGGAQEPVGTLEVALAHAAKLLATDPVLASEQAGEILKVAPGHPVATIILGASHRARGDAPAALEILEPLALAHPTWVSTHYELGLALGLAGRASDAAAALRRAVAIKPEMGDAWRALGDNLTALGDTQGADAAYAQHIKASTRDPRLLKPASALVAGRVPEAESLLREHLKRFPTDVAAIRMLAEVAGRLGRYRDAETLLVRCLELAPGFHAARLNLALVLQRQDRFADALREVERVLQADPANVGGRNLKAAVLGRLGEVSQSAEIYRKVLDEFPTHAKVWHSYGHALRTTGRHEECVAAYHRTIELAPTYGEAYWSLANLKTYRFTAADVEQMAGQLDRDDLTVEDRFHLNFALGKALEDQRDYARSFRCYAEGNRLRRSLIAYDPEAVADRVRRTRELFTTEFIASRRGSGAQAPDPIFIVGLPRAGSTLLEQILSSHSAVEGTMELPDIAALVRELGGRKHGSDVSAYPGILVELEPGQLRSLGERYLEGTRVQRKTTAPYFIDKNPNNWLAVGFIQLILPNAKIIDARRHPMSCCFSVFKQHFARGNRFSYDLGELGRYYLGYVDLMAHFDSVMPGRIHRAIYERVVEDTEGEVRRLLAYCGLPFEEACLRFYENERAVRTASSEQVRQPIYRDALEQWTHYRPWLEALEFALGPALETWSSRD